MAGSWLFFRTFATKAYVSEGRRTQYLSYSCTILSLTHCDIQRFPQSQETHSVQKCRICHLHNTPFRNIHAIECFHLRGQHLCKFIGTKESVCIRKEFNSHGGRFIVLGHQYGRRDVMWKHSIFHPCRLYSTVLVSIDTATRPPFTRSDSLRVWVHWRETKLPKKRNNNVKN